MVEMGTFVFRWPYPANDVHVTGTFDDWGKTVQLEKVGDHWEKEVELAHATEAYFYKFVVDDVWQVDENAPKAGDGHWNTNNVLYPENIKRKPKPEPAPESHSTPGAFPATPGEEKAFSVQPIPATEGASNPISLPAGEKVPEHKDVTSNTIGSKITTSKEDYENADNAPFPGTGTKEESTFSVAPIPASGTTGNPVSVPAGSQLPDHEKVTANTVGSNVTTSKEDYDNAGSRSLGLAAGAGAAGAASVAAAGVAVESAFNKKPEKGETIIPESGLPVGGETLAAHEPSPFLFSSGSGATTAALASNVPLEEKKEATVVDPVGEPKASTAAPSVPEVVKDSLAQSHKEPEAAASSEAVREKSAVEKELLSKTHVSEASGEPASAAKSQSSFYGLATTVPEPVESSMKKAHAAPEAAAEPSVVAEKSAVEKELLAKVPTTDGASEPAPTIAASTSPTAPAATSAPIASTAVAATAGTAAVGGSALAGSAIYLKDEPVHATTAVEDPTLAEEPAVKLVNQETIPEPTAPVAAPVSTPAAPVASEDHSSTVPIITGVPTLASTGTVPQSQLGQEKHEGVATIGTGSVPAPTTAAATPSTDGPSTPAKKIAAGLSTTSSPAGSAATTERKKKHRLSAFIKKILH